jgi:hypothetical protein
LTLTGIVDRWTKASSEHMGKRLTKLQRRPRILRGNISEITSERFSLALWGAPSCSLFASLESIFV